MEKVTFYAVTHKEPYKKIPTGRTLIGVGGGVRSHNIRGISVCDDCGDNISDKNDSYCELTALYWIWKNDTSDIVGFEHYRRFFLRYGRLFKIFISPKFAIRKLKKYDAILPCLRKIKNGRNLYQQYDELFHIKDLDCCRAVIKEKYPEYADVFDATMEQHEMFCCNMFVMKKDLMAKYCEWVFPVLFEVENRIDISDYDPYQRRVFGFLAERLFNVWVNKNCLKVYFATETNIELRPNYWEAIKHKLKKQKI